MVLRIDNQYIAADVNPQRRTAEPSEFHDRAVPAARETVNKSLARALRPKSSHMHVKNVADGRRYVARDRPFPPHRGYLPPRQAEKLGHAVVADVEGGHRLAESGIRHLKFAQHGESLSHDEATVRPLNVPALDVDSNGAKELFIRTDA